MSSQIPAYSFEPDPNVTVRATLVNTNTLQAGSATIASSLIAGNIITGNYDIADSTITDLSSTRIQTQRLEADTDIIFGRNLTGNLNTNETFTDVSQRVFVLENQELDLTDISQRIYDLSEYTHNEFNIVYSDISGRHDDLSSHVDLQVARLDSDISYLSGRHSDLSSYVDLQITRLDSDISDLSGRLTDLSYSLGATIQSELIPLIGIVNDISQKNLGLSNYVNTNIIRLDTDIFDLSGRVNQNEDSISELFESTLTNIRNLGTVLLATVSGDVSGFITVSGEENQFGPSQDLSNGEYLIPSGFSPGTNTTLVIDGKSNNYNHIKINTFQRGESFNMKVVILDVSGITGVSVSTYSNDTFDVSTSSIFRTSCTLGNLPIHTTELYHHGVGSEKVFTIFDLNVIQIPAQDNSIIVISDNYSQAQP